MSNQIYAGLLSCIGKLQIVLDDQESLIALYQLLSAMDPVTVNIQVRQFITTVTMYMCNSADGLTSPVSFPCPTPPPHPNCLALTSTVTLTSCACTCCIARNFRGIQFSRKAICKDLADGRTRIENLHSSFLFRGFNFRCLAVNCENSENIGSLENFRPYGSSFTRKSNPQFIAALPTN